MRFERYWQTVRRRSAVSTHENLKHQLIELIRKFPSCKPSSIRSSGVKRLRQDSFYGQFKDRLEAAKKIQEMLSKKADPVLLKGAYAKIFKAAIAEPCQETGTYRLRFIIGDGEIKNPVPFGGQGSVMNKMVRATGLEPARLTVHAPQTCVSTIPPRPHTTRF